MDMQAKQQDQLIFHLTGRHQGDGLASIEGNVGLQRDDAAAELAYRDLEGRPRPERRLLEQHGHMLAGQRVSGGRFATERPVRLHLRRELQAPFEVRRVEAEHGEKVFARSCHG